MTAKRITKSKANVARAIRELDITVPYYTCRLVGNRLEFRLYGGLAVYWPPKPATKPAKRTRKTANQKEDAT